MAVKTLEHDPADRVSSIEYRKADDTPVETLTYAYDAGGQRRQRGAGTSPVPETPFSATYDEANRLTAITLNGEAFTLAYDDNGNLTAKSGPVSGTTTYTWNARNQLASISGAGGSATFRYDALGRRIEKTVNGQSTGYLYDGAQAIAELKGSSLDTVYHTGLAIDEVLARYGASGNKTLLTDALMSVIAQANDDQSIGNFYAYSAYGEATPLGPDEGNPLQYTGRENDGTGLYYYRARYYDPVLKRFISDDPIGLAGGSINVSAYVAGNPVSFADPTGLANGGWNQGGYKRGICGGFTPPDFINFQIDYYVGSLWGTFSRTGNSYVGGGLNIAKPNPLQASATVTAGWLNSPNTTPQMIDNFIQGYGGTAAGAYGIVGGGIAWSPGNGTATLVGIGAGVQAGSAFPATVSVGIGNTVLQGQTGISW